MTRTAVNIAWLAGIVEGEGYITSLRGSPSIRIAMTDADIVQRVAALWKVRALGPYKPRGPQTKHVWNVGVHGYMAIGWMMTLYVFLGDRRRAAVRESVAKWNAAPGHARKVRGSDGLVLPSLCHPTRALHARQMCRECYMSKYMRAWRAKRKVAA